MALEMRKNMKLSDDQEVTSQQRDLSVGTEANGGEEQVGPLAWQSSILPLTLEELQQSLCETERNVESINIDEFMTNIWNVEEFQATTGGFMEDAEAALMGTTVGGGDSAEESGLCRQGSFSLPPPQCRKTVDEVWAEFNQEPAQAQVLPRPLVQPQPQLGSGGVADSGWQATLGDMTLDDFLVKAGVVRGSLAGQSPMPVSGLLPGTMNPIPMQQQPEQPGPIMYMVAPSNAMYPVMGAGMGFPGGCNGGMAVVPPPPPSQGAATHVSPGSLNGMSTMTHADMMNCSGNGSTVENGARKRCATEDGPDDKSVERRNRRMIKNRESASRYRARQQAYTLELEAELNNLKEENARLRAEEKLILLAEKQMLAEKMIEQSKENVNAKKVSRSCRSWSCMW